MGAVPRATVFPRLFFLEGVTRVTKDWKLVISGLPRSPDQPDRGGNPVIQYLDKTVARSSVGEIVVHCLFFLLPPFHSGGGGDVTIDKRCQ